MKTLKQILNVAALLLTLSLVVACDNKKNSNTNTANVNAAGGFAYTNGGTTCVALANNQQVDLSYCQNYSLNNQYNQYGGVQQCNGIYWVWSGYQWSQIQCMGSNCSNQTVYPSGATSPAQAIRCL